MISLSKSIARYSNLVVKRTKGSFIYTNNDKKILDLTSGIGSNVLGHCPDRISKLVSHKAQTLVHSQPNCYLPNNISPFFKELERFIPRHLNSSILSLSGSECIDNALKIAKLYTKRKYILSLNNAFHGRTLLSLSVSGRSLREYVGEKYLVNDCININPGQMLSHDILINTAAIIFEPIQGERGGYHSILPEYIRYLRKVSNNYDIVLISDEVQTFLRTGKYISYDDVDMIVLAKGLAGAYPLGALIGKSSIMDSIKTGIIGGTFQGNALSIAVATETLKIIKEENVLENVEEKGKQLKDFLIASKHIPLVRGKGLMLAIEFDTQKECDDFFEKALDKNILLMKTSYPKTLRLMPPLNINQDEINMIIDNFKQILTD